MKKILLLFVAMICAAAGWATDEVTATYTSSKLDVALTNSTEFVAFQMDIVLDADVNVTNIAKAGRLKDGASVTIGSETVTTEFIVASNQISVADGKQTIRVIAYNMNNHAISDAEGSILTATLSDKPENVTIENILFVTKDNLEEMLVNLGTVEETVDFVPGDINRDGSPTVSDITCLIRIINNDNVLSSWNLEAADCNHDGVPSVSDVTVLINLINNFGK